MPPRTTKQQKTGRCPLPRSRDVLALLLREVEHTIEFLQLAHQRQQQRLEIVRGAVTDSKTVISKIAFGRALNAASVKHFATGARAPSLVLGYLDQAALKVAWADYQAAREALPTGRLLTLDLAWLREWAARFARVMEADDAMIAMLRALQADLIAALERGADTSDTGADKPSEKQVRLPKNLEVLELARLINQDLGREGSQMAIALQVTGGDQPKARNLLRQLRRFRHLLNQG